MIDLGEVGRRRTPASRSGNCVPFPSSRACAHRSGLHRFVRQHGLLEDLRIAADVVHAGAWRTACASSYARLAGNLSAGGEGDWSRPWSSGRRRDQRAAHAGGAMGVLGPGECASPRARNFPGGRTSAQIYLASPAAVARRRSPASPTTTGRTRECGFDQSSSAAAGWKFGEQINTDLILPMPAMPPEQMMRWPSRRYAQAG
jgi:hypothetical protein